MGAIVSPLIKGIPSQPAPTAPAAPAPTVAAPAVDSTEAEREAAAAARRAILARRKTGLLSTIATSARGVLAPGDLAVARRSLLGE
jgi:hypothetical protein